MTADAINLGMLVKFVVEFLVRKERVADCGLSWVDRAP